jgi:hypothetical protein
MNYNLYVSSNDKLSGLNNNGTYQVNWQDFLDVKVEKYKVNFVLTTNEGFYVDSGPNAFGSSCININTNSRIYSFNTSSKNQSNCLGFLTRSTNGFTTITGSPQNNLPVVIERPTSNQINISFINLQSGLPLVSTDATGNLQSDMTGWTGIFTFIPISSEDNLNKLKYI